jgi:hypothetical protein
LRSFGIRATPPLKSDDSLRTSDAPKVEERVAEKVAAGEAEVLRLFARNGHATPNEMAEALGVSGKTI